MCDREGSVYDDIIRDSTEEEASAISTLLQRLIEIGENIELVILNLKREQNLPRHSMVDILNYLKDNIKNNEHFDEKKFENTYKKICRDHSLQGRKIEGLNIEYFGNAIFKGELIVRILAANKDNKKAKYPNFRRSIEQYIDRLIQNENIDRFSYLKEMLIHYPKAKMWATWATTEQGYPFDFMQTRTPSYLGSLYEVRLSLALEYASLEDKDCGSMLLLTYGVAEIEAHIPTIADAGTYQYFSPSLRASRYGLTNPSHPKLQEYYTRRLEEHGYQNYNRDPRPEAVHIPITLGRLHTVEELLPTNEVT